MRGALGHGRATPTPRRAASAATTSATCRSGTSWPGSIRSTSMRDARVRGAGRQGPRLHRGRQGDPARGRARAPEQGHPGVSRRRPSAARSRSRRRRSTTRFCRCCATPTSTCGRIPTRRCRGSAFVHPEDAAEQLERAVACHERLFGRRPVGLWPSEGSVSDAMVPLVARGRLPVDGDRRADSRAHARRRPSRATATAISSSPSTLYAPVSRPGRRRDGRVRVPRPRAVGPDRVHLRRLGGRGGGRRLRRPAGRGRPALRASGPAGKRRSISDHPRRRERLGALRGRRPAVPARAVSAARRPPRAADGDDGRGVRGADATS